MDTQDRQKLTAALGTLPDGFQYDNDIVYYKHGTNQLRALWIFGSNRVLVAFRYPLTGPYQLYYLNRTGKLVAFSQGGIVNRWRIKNKKKALPEPPMEEILGTWFRRNGAQQFKGRGWAEECAAAMLDLMGQWPTLNSEKLSG